MIKSRSTLTKQTIALQVYSERNEIGREEKSILNHAIMERLDYTYINEKSLTTPPSNLRLFVGSVEGTQMVLSSMNKVLPVPDYYPEALTKYLGSRSVKRTTINEVFATIAAGKSTFVKPVYDWKSFTGFVADESVGYGTLSKFSIRKPVWISEIVNFQYEFRAYVSKNELLAVCQYTGEMDMTPNFDIILSAIKKLKDSGYPYDTYAFDWGYTTAGEFILVEMNGAFSIGKYCGITDKQYYTFLNNGWSMITS
ncbi:ATP-grasp domain-containing protein [Photobacterium kishitanii]|uniref:ATP-grasp domain-containing protein n=1 Tax=Photobacterium kishitanii TaxID=318456 RepID=A0A2T3KM07_9GAMM|nr:ATP-grasp domain-containing protein [Photobacterium kishitanii]PSV00716.1 hypothetical protein C9J27_06125 [Photobacterium kishitanii]